jgi:FixJ family two-component response regulator
MTEDEREERTERAKAILRLEQSVLTHWVEGIALKTSAARLNQSPSTVQRLRAHLRLTTGQAWRAGVKPMGRSHRCVIRLESR